MKLSKYFRSPLFYFFLFLTGYFGFTKLSDLDFGFHLAQGKYFFEHHWQLPKTDPFSFTMAGESYPILSWLFDLLLYAAFFLGGYCGLTVWKAVSLVFLIVLFILRLDSALTRKGKMERNWLSYAGAFLFLIAVYDWINVERPHVWGYIYFSFFLLVFTNFMEQTKKWHWIALSICQILWTNSHSSFGYGIVFSFFFLLGLFGEYFYNKYILGLPDVRLFSTFQAIQKVAVLLGLQCLVSLINPYGFFIFINAAKAAFSSNYYLVQELWAVKPQQIMSLKGFFLFLAAVSIWIYWKKKSLGMILPLIAFASIGLWKRRLLYDFIVFSAPLTLAESINLLDRYAFMKKKYIKIGCLTVLMGIFACYSNRIFSHGSGISENQLPVKASDFILRENIKGPMFNSFGLGGYLIWSLYPRHQVYIDGRGQLYNQKDHNVLLEYYKILANPEFWKEVDHRRNFNFAVVDWPFFEDGKLYNSTSKHFTNDLWAPVFFDAKSIIYLKRNAYNQPLIHKYEYRYINPQELDPTYFQAYLQKPAQWDLAQKEFERAIAENPSNYRIHFMYASFLAQNSRRNKEEVLRHLKLSYELNPQFVQAKEIMKIFQKFNP